MAAYARFHEPFRRQSSREVARAWLDIKNGPKNVSELDPVNNVPRRNVEWRGLGKEVPASSNG
jgi:hypothetical protein